MFNSKKDISNSAQKVDLVKENLELENKAEKIKQNIEPTKFEQIQTGKGDVFSALDNYKKWSKENNFEEKTKDYLRSATDGVVKFLEGLIKGKK